MEREPPLIDFEQSAREYRLLDALLANAHAALRSKKHKDVIHKMDCWAAIKLAVQKKVEVSPQDARRISEVVCAARWWDSQVIGIGKKGSNVSGPWIRAIVDQEGRAWVPNSAKAGLPFDALSLIRTLKHDRTIHSRFVRRGRKFLKALYDFRGWVEECENRSQGYKTCIDACDRLAVAIEARIKVAPSLHGTTLQPPSTQTPKNFAASVIVPLLRRCGYKRDRALWACLDLLEIVWPDIRADLKTRQQEERFLESLRKACSRSGRPR